MNTGIAASILFKY